LYAIGIYITLLLSEQQNMTDAQWEQTMSRQLGMPFICGWRPYEIVYNGDRTAIEEASYYNVQNRLAFVKKWELAVERRPNSHLDGNIRFSFSPFCYATIPANSPIIPIMRTNAALLALDPGRIPQNTAFACTVWWPLFLEAPETPPVPQPRRYKEPLTAEQRIAVENLMKYTDPKNQLEYNYFKRYMANFDPKQFNKK
jgi:hypothetical protein